MECLICKTEFDGDRCYGDSQCSNCGQQYAYDEKVSIVLTENQIAILAAVGTAYASVSRLEQQLEELRSINTKLAEQAQKAELLERQVAHLLELRKEDAIKAKQEREGPGWTAVKGPGC